jgi:hypothetical protein
MGFVIAAIHHRHAVGLQAITERERRMIQVLRENLDIVDLEEKFGYTPYIIHDGGNCYVIVSEDQAKRGTIQTVLIDLEGGIINKSVEFFGNSQGSILLRPMIIKMTESYLIAFNGENRRNLYMHLKTYNVTNWD